MDSSIAHPGSRPLPDTAAPAVQAQIIHCGDCLTVLSAMPDACVDLVCIDPPFNSNRSHGSTGDDPHEAGYFDDRHRSIEAYIDYMRPRCGALHRVLKDTGSFYYHCDWHASHYVKVMLDQLFGRDRFQNEIIWVYQTGGASRRRYARKHDAILFYAKTDTYTFNADAIREARTEKSIHRARAAGARIAADDTDKLPTDVFQIPALNPMARERLGYPTQKPLALLERIIKASSNPGDLVMDAFCGSGTTLVAAQGLARRWVGIDLSPVACRLAADRLRAEGEPAEQ